VYPHSPEKVWRALTEPQAIGAWLMPNDFAARVGHRFQFRGKPQGGWDGIVHCEVLEVDPPKRLVYTWTSNMLDTRVAFTLQAEPGGTRLRLDHTGFDGFKAWMVSLILGSGWKGIVSKGIRAVVDKLVRGVSLSSLSANECDNAGSTAAAGAPVSRDV
jgi:uncharacterized protein YndB with AHSA1/START domain